HQWREKLAGSAGELRRGFKLLNDLSDLDSMDRGCIPDIEFGMELLDKSGIAKVVRIFKDLRDDGGGIEGFGRLEGLEEIRNPTGRNPKEIRSPKVRIPFSLRIGRILTLPRSAGLLTGKFTGNLFIDVPIWRS